MLPILHFTYADPLGDLENVKRERKYHYDLLVPRFLKGDYGFFQNSDFNQDDLDFGFKNYLNRVTVFHFSGHAGMAEIYLQDGQSFIKGIARKMRTALTETPLPKLVLVFLNGCSTAFMVNELLGAGVPMVIGTSRPVGDKMATDFSITFYEALSEGKTIQESFTDAETYLVTRDKTTKIFRGLGLDEFNDNEPLWGLFHQENKRHVLNWKIPSSININNHYQINEIIQGALYHSLLRAGSERIKDLENDREAGKDIFEDINANILLSFPGPIAHKIQKLFSVEIDNKNISEKELLSIHLNNIYELYQGVLELIFVITLSQLWEICLGDITINRDGEEVIEKKPELPIDRQIISDHLDIIKEYFVKSRKERRYFDYVSKIEALRKIFCEVGHTEYISEQEFTINLLQKDEDLSACYNYFNSVRIDFQNQAYLNFDQNNWKEKCESGERFIAQLFNKISFYCRYDFGILKSIEINLPRFKTSPAFIYKLLKIPKTGNPRYISCSPNLSGFTSVRSIVMLKAEAFGNNPTVQRLKGHINLSPFMLDFNVGDPKAEKGNLGIYSHYDRATRSFLYDEAFNNNSSQYIKDGDPIYKEVHDTFKEFISVLFCRSIDDVFN